MKLLLSVGVGLAFLNAVVLYAVVHDLRHRVEALEMSRRNA